MDENPFFRLVVRFSGWPRFGNPRDLKPARLIVRRLSEIDFMSSLAKSQLPERAQIGTFEKSAKRLLERFEASHSESPAERRVVQLYTCAFVCNGVNGQDVNPSVSHRLS
jgi:hypothetical protein